MISLPLYLLVVNALTFLLYWFDKRAARRGGWRISEYMLLMWGLAGGTLAAFAAQRVLRHKNRKKSFQFKFWLLTAVQIALLVFPPHMLRVLLAKLFY